MKNISLFGQDFMNVPAVNVPKTGGGIAQFDDTTDADATASDIAVGKTAYVSGNKITGTATPPTGTKQISITENGTYIEDVASYANAEIEVDVSSGGSSPMVLLDTRTLSEAVRSVTINTESEWLTYDVLIVRIVGSFPSPDWFYWNVNSTTQQAAQYSSQKATINEAFMVISSPVIGKTSATIVTMSVQDVINSNNPGGVNIETLSYFWFSGYSKDIQSGTTFTIWGYKYADL